MTLSEAATGVFLSGVLKGAEECLRFLKGFSAAFMAHWFSNMRLNIFTLFRTMWWGANI